MFNAAKLNNLRANKNSNPPRGPIDNLGSIDARRMVHSPTREKRAKLCKYLEWEPMSLLKSKKMHLASQSPKKPEAKCSSCRIPKKKAPTVPSTYFKTAAEGAQGEGQT